jgi:hypothetical protein
MDVLDRSNAGDSSSSIGSPRADECFFGTHVRSSRYGNLPAQTSKLTEIAVAWHDLQSMRPSRPYWTSSKHIVTVILHSTDRGDHLHLSLDLETLRGIRMRLLLKPRFNPLRRCQNRPNAFAEDSRSCCAFPSHRRRSTSYQSMLKPTRLDSA